MKIFISTPLTLSVLFISLFSFQSCKKTDPLAAAEAATYAGQVTNDALLVIIGKSLVNTQWKISSESVSPAINGSTVVTLPTYARPVVYKFGSMYGAVAAGGGLTIIYHEKAEPNYSHKDSVKVSFAVTAVPNTLNFADNGLDFTPSTYTIVKPVKDSLILSSVVSGYTYTKVYLKTL